ncbi:MAG: two-component system response regulator [Acidobacteria bacterium]|nr:two-component system response regulator [Acidobacteriota bacterium]
MEIASAFEMTTSFSHRPILVVEDNPIDVELVRRAFGRRHASNPIETLEDGAEVLQQIHEWEAGKPSPILILLDLQLPGASGLEVLRQIKTHPKFSRIPVIILTASGESADAEAAYNLGANSYIVKPIDFDRLLQVTDQIELYWTILDRLPLKS